MDMINLIKVRDEKEGKTNITNAKFNNNVVFKKLFISLFLLIMFILLNTKKNGLGEEKIKFLYNANNSESNVSLSYNDSIRQIGNIPNITELEKADNITKINKTDNIYNILNNDTQRKTTDNIVPPKKKAKNKIKRKK